MTEVRRLTTEYRCQRTEVRMQMTEVGRQKTEGNEVGGWTLCISGYPSLIDHLKIKSFALIQPFNKLTNKRKPNDFLC